MFTDYDFVQFYIKQLDNMDNTWMINQFKEAIEIGKNVLELGSGIGLDYSELKKDYNITASEYSDVFIDEFKKRLDDDILKIDIRNFKLENKVDCIYGNKIIPFIRYAELNNAIENLYNNLNDDGQIFLSTWVGSEEQHVEYTDENGKEISFWLAMHSQKLLEEKFEKYFELDFIKYSVREENDSLILIGKKK